MKLIVGCHKKVHAKTPWFIYLIKIVLKTTSNVILNMKKGDLDEW